MTTPRRAEKPAAAQAQSKPAAAKPSATPAANPRRAPAKPGVPAQAASPAHAGAAPLVLHILRHADAGDATTWIGDDAERPLSKKGRRQARRLGRHLADLGVDVDVIRTSPRVRAADTAKLVGKALGVRPSVHDALGGGFDFDDLRGLVGGLTGDVGAVMIVGHDPDLSDLVSRLVGAHVGLVKGSLATIGLDGRDPAPGRGTLRWLLPPDAVRG